MLDFKTLIGDNKGMKYETKKTNEFTKWLKSLKDKVTKNRILFRLDRIENGNFGDWSDTSEHNVYELRFFFGSGYRIYYTIRNNTVVFLLNGGDKSSQNKDIKKARKILDTLEE